VALGNKGKLLQGADPHANIQPLKILTPNFYVISSIR
jgi:hypothetical protein